MKTERGFGLIKFRDMYDCQYSIQKSSLATEDAIWFGIDDPNPQIMASDLELKANGWVKFPLSDKILLTTRMHLSVNQVKELIPILQKFVDTGEID